MYKFFFICIISVGIFITMSCNKDEGEGGEATIKGKITLREYDPDFSTLQQQIPAFEEDVYIQYGNQQGVGDKVVTDLSGNFKFNYLQSGKYTIYIYSEDSTKKDKNKYSKSLIVSVDGSETVTVPEIVKYKTIDIDEGSGTIAGKVWQINYKINYVAIKDTSRAQELDVYLTYGNHTTFDIRERTNHDGRYEFRNLAAGTYTVFVYTENKKGATELIPIKIEKLVISKDSQYITNKDIYIEVED